MRTEILTDDQRGDGDTYTYDLLPFRALNEDCYCQAIKFLDFDWHGRFTAIRDLTVSIRDPELKIAIILTLMTCPNHSCVTKHLPKKILYLLKVRTNRAPKEEFSSKVEKQVNWLAKKRIIKNYKSTNNRVKLLSSYHNFLEKLFPYVMKTIAADNDIAGNPSTQKEVAVEGYEKEERVDTADDSNSVIVIPFEEGYEKEERVDTADDSNSVIVTPFEEGYEKAERVDTADLYPRIPDLPDIIDNSESADTQKPGEETDNDDLLEKLFKDTENKAIASFSPKDIAGNRERLNDGAEITTLFEFIKTNFQEMKNVEIDQSPRKLAMHFRYGSNVIPIHITYNSLNNEIHVKAFINCRPEAAVDMLRNWPNICHSGWLCIEKHSGKEFFVVQGKVDLNRYDNKNIIDITLNMLEAAKRIYDISGQKS